MKSKQEEYLKWFILIVIIYIIVRYINKFTSGQTIFGGGTGGGLGAGVFDKPTETIKTDLQKYASIGVFPTISESTASSYADLIYSENMSLNTNEAAILDIFTKLRNEPDLLLLKEKFGTRRPQFGTSYMGLSAFLRSDLSDSWISKINTALSRRAISNI